MPSIVPRGRLAPAAATTKRLSSGGGGGKKDDDNKSPPTPRKGAIPERFFDAKSRRPEGLLRTQRKIGSDQELWMTPEILSSFEQNYLLKDLQAADSERADELDFEYLLDDRKTSGYVGPEEFDFFKFRDSRKKPHELVARLDTSKKGPLCNKKQKYHIFPQDKLTIANLPLLREFLSENGTINKRSVTRLCSKCQRKVRNAVKSARALGFIPHDAGYDAINQIGFPDEEHKSHISKTI